MKNTILKFDQEEVDDFIVSNYFSKNISIYSFLTESIKSEYFTTYKILDNDKIERISYEIYGTTDYWDLLLLINDREALCGMTYDFETCTSNVESYINKYEFEIYSNNDISDQRKEELLEEFYEKYKLRNELNRYMYIIKPSKMQDFLKILKMAGFEW